MKKAGKLVPLVDIGKSAMLPRMPARQSQVSGGHPGRRPYNSETTGACLARRTGVRLGGETGANERPCNERKEPRVADVENEKIQAVIDEIRPLLQADGGDIDLVGVEDGVVKVRLRGACAGCPGAQMTLKMAVERRIKMKVPEVQRVESV